MASNYTTNYQLNQWAKSDRILREDFNANNAKIEAALNGQAEALAAETAAREAADTALAQKSSFTKLKDITLAADTEEFSIDVSDIDWGQWQNIHIDMNLNNGSQGYLYLNSTSNPYLTGINNGWSADFANPYHRFTWNPGRWPQRYVSGFFGGNYVSGSVQYSDLTTLIFSGDKFFATGKVVIWGEA